MNSSAAGPGKPTTRAPYVRRVTRPVLWTGVALLLAAAIGHGQDTDTPAVDRLVRNSATGVVLPQTALDVDATFRARRASTWQAGSTHRLLLENDVSISVGSYGFQADRAVITITRRRALGGVVHDLAIYLDDVTALGGHGPIQADAPRLLVTAVVKGKVELLADLLERRAANDHPLVQDAVARIDRYQQAQATRIVDLGSRPPLYSADTLARGEQRGEPMGDVAVEQAPRDVVVEGEDASPREPAAEIPQRPTPAPSDVADQTPQAAPDLDQLQRVQFRADKIVYEQLDDEAAGILMGNVQVMHHDPATGRSLSLSADRAVLFTAPGVLRGEQEVNADTVRGVYLEDNVVATDGQYTMRGPRVFFDLQTQRAIVLDAVFFTYDIEQQVPIYVRARKLMQVSENQWQARQARLSTSEFYEPHFALGVDRLTVQREQTDDDRTTYAYDARDTTFRVGDTPVFYWPRLAGEAGNTPLRRARVRYDTQDGVVINTRWDAFAAAGARAPEGVSGTILADVYTNRGFGAGFELDYDVPKAFGDFFAYGMYDTGEDEPGGRDEIEPEDEFRNLVHWQHRHLLPDGWEISTELSWLGDPTFLESFFAGNAYHDKPWETSLYVKKQENDWAFTFLTRYDLLDFVPQLPQLQTPGYTVDKLPEIAYYRIGTSLFDDTVTWFSENRAGLMRLNLPTDSPRERGFNQAESLAIFGMARTMRFDDALDAAGYNDDLVGRFDTRQEFNLPLKLGPIDIVPYLVGRVTAYDDEFDDFSDESENLRLWGQAGVKLHTTFSRTYDSVESRLLDLHRLRHIVEPFINLSYASTNVEQQHLPVYDNDVESLAEGYTAKLGLRNTWQTQRGGPDHWYSVDVFRLDTEFVIQDDDTVRESPIARFFDYRPEFALAGDHFYTEMAWRITDTLSTVANLNYSFDDSEVERWNAGLMLDHSPRLSSFAELRHISDLNTLLFRYGFEYLLSTKYHLAFSQSFDLDRDEVRDLNVTLTRRMPRALLQLTVSVDEVGDVNSVGVAFVPEGGGGAGDPGENPFVFTR